MSRRDLSVVLVVVFCMMLVSACVAAPQAAPPTPVPSPTAEPPSGTPPEILAAFQQATNEQDLDALMSLFVEENPSFAETGFASVYGAAQLRSYWDAQFGLGSVVKALRDCSLTGETWHCTVVARDDCYVVYGVTESESDFSARLKDGKIQTVTVTPSSDNIKLVREKLAEFYAWVQANRPDDWKTLNTSVMSRAVGEAYSRTCKEYAATRK
ncbi:MAG: nuclear transport factor 2 family protein [Anaerolineae bacterium]|jgi:hypothetical protein|nr:nuclear transport factor 2 family protein [Anaerolineae bacterium]